MRGNDKQQLGVFSYVSPEQRVPADHPLRPLRAMANETNYFSAELSLVQAQLNELLALVQLYRGLGGGWEQ